MITQQITPCLWFDTEAEAAANFYVSIFKKNSKIGAISRYGKGFEKQGKKENDVMVVAFELNGQKYTALNGGPYFKFNESVSLQIFCDTQEDIDYYWDNLLKDGGQESQCGWLKDKYGFSWQVVPSMIAELMSDPARSERVTKAFMQMKKFDIEKLKNA